MNHSKVYLDIESFSRCDLKKSGLAKYAEHESTDVLCACWAFDNGPVSAWIPQADQGFLDALQPLYNWGALYAGPAVPRELSDAILSRMETHAWNAAFERLVLNGTAGQRYDFPKIETSQAYCSMVNARVHGLPGALEDAANAVNASVKKRINGVNSMRFLCRPKKNGERPMLINERERFLSLLPYCADDVAAERAVDNIVPRMSDAELRIYRELDQPMNDRGWKVDLESVDSMETLVHVYKKELEKRCRDITGIKPSRAGPLADWIRQHGVPDLENLQADTVRKVLKRESDLPPETVKVLKIYSTFGMKAVAKYPAMRKAAGSGDRLRHLFGMYGAGTGRWTSYIVQLQNLFRPVINDPEMAIEIAREWDLEWLRANYPGVDPMKVIASCVRSCLVADEGKDLIFPDFSGVEARFNAWMFNETWKLSAYRDYDKGIGANLYCIVYGRCFGVDPTSPEGLAGKQIGKVLDLSMGYEGGVGAFVKMAGTYKIDLKDMAEKTYPTLPADVLEESVDAYHYAAEQGRLYELPEKIWITAEALKRLWRRAHPGITQGWVDLKQAAILAVENPGSVHKVAGGRIMYKVEGDFLICRLPSARRLYYYKPNVRTDKTGRQALHYLGMNTITRQWGPTSTYGGKQCLAKGTLVLTGGGWKPIQRCTHLDSLWDGHEWVYSGGLVAQGVRSVIRYQGVDMTSDHEVLTNEGWRSATLAQSERLDGAKVRIPDHSPLHEEREWKDLLAGAVPMRNSDRSRGRGLDAVKRALTEVLRLRNETSDKCQPDNARPVSTSRLLDMAKHEGSLRQSETSCVEGLWRSGNKGLQALAAIRKVLAGYGAFIPGRLEHRTSEQQSGLLFAQLQVGYSSGASSQHESKRFHQRHDHSGSRAESWAKTVHCVYAQKGRLAKERMAETFDLFNAGPRHRFTILSNHGPLIVHNCENETQAGCRDLLVRAKYGLIALDDFELLGSVHDEPIGEVPEGWHAEEEVTRIMCINGEWDSGLPLAVEMHRGKRYRK
jgi:DNA polymerase bacteriophage-type